MSFLLEIREAAKQCFDEDLRIDLRAAADRLDGALAALAADPTTEAMVAVNGLWVLAYNALARVQDGGDATPGGTLHGVLLQEAA